MGPIIVYRTTLLSRIAYREQLRRSYRNLPQAWWLVLRAVSRRLRSEIASKNTTWRLRHATDQSVIALVEHVCPNLVLVRVGGKEGAPLVSDKGAAALAQLPRLQQVSHMCDVHLL